MALEDLLIASMTGAYNMASLKEQKSARKAQESYNKKLIELQQQGLALQAQQLAQTYAMQQAQLEWEKESFKQEFAETQKQNQIENEFNAKQQQLDEVWRTAEQTGFRDGAPTLAMLDFQEGQRQFDLTREDNERDFFEKQRQFDVDTVMNAPRGPADWAAYTKRLRALQGNGAMPGAVGAMFDPSQQVASFSSGGQQTGPVLSNTDLALAMTGRGDPSALQGTAWQQQAAPQGGGGQQTQLAQSSGGTTQIWGGMTQQGQGAAPQGQVQTNSSNPYSATGQPSGNSEKVAAMLGQQPAQQQQQSSMTLPSAQKFRRFAPTEQAMGLGYLAEEGGPTEDDAKYLMERQAPQFRRGQQARYAGI